MEVSFVKELDCHKKRCLHLTQSSRSPLELRSPEQSSADYEVEADNCDHFTIRGYVAEIRKRDAKICWPFIMLDHSTSDEEAKSLPPLPVIKFRRWNCQDCLHKTAASENVNGAIGVKGKSDCTSLHGNLTLASRSLGPRLLPKENSSEGRLAEAESCDNVINGKCHPSLCSGKKETETVIKDKTREGKHEALDHLSAISLQSNKDQNRSSKLPFVVTKGKASWPGDIGERKKDVTTAFIGEDSPFGMDYANRTVNELSKNVKAFGNVDNRQLSKTEKMKELHDDAIKKNAMPPGEIVNIDPQTANAVHIHYPGSYLDNSSHKASVVNVCPSDNSGESQDYANMLCSSNGKLQHKKARKVRLLNDIIKSEELQMSQEIVMSNVDADNRKTWAHNDEKVDESKGATKGQECRSLLHLQRSKTAPRKRRKDDDSSEDDDEWPSLMHWLKTVSKKHVARQEDAKTKFVNDAASETSESTLDAHQGKGIDLNLEGCGTRVDDKAVLDVKQCAALQAQAGQPCTMPLKDSVAGKWHMRYEDIPSEQTLPTSTGIKIIEKSPHQALQIKDGTNNKAILSKKKNEAVKVENGEYFQTHWLGDSSYTHKHKNISDSQRQKRAMKKQKVIQICEQEASDDFPMDIVELLAKNQHERCMMNAAASTGDLHRVSEMAKDGNHGLPLDFSKGQVNKVSDTVDKRSSQQTYHPNSTESIAWTTCKGTGCADCNMRPYDSYTNARGYQSIDLNRQDPTDASVGFHALSGFCNYPKNGVNVPTINTSRDRVVLQVSESFNNAKRNSSQNTSRDVQGGLAILFNGIPYGTNVQKVNGNFNQVNCDLSHPNMDSHDPYFQKNLNMVAYKNDNQRLINSTGAITIDTKEKTESSVKKGSFAAPTSFVESSRVCHAKVSGPSDLYADETIPAMHLLRLMDPTACLGESLYASMDMNHRGYIQESDFSNNQHHQHPRLEAGVKTAEAIKHLGTIANTNQDQHIGNPRKPLRPLPRVGVLSSLLQKELTAHTNRCKTAFGFKPRGSSQLLPPRIGGRVQAEVFQSASLIRAQNCQAFVSRDESSKHIASDAESLMHLGGSRARDDMARIDIYNKDGAVQPMERSCKTEICTTNRNPADFAIVDENCEYMIGSDQLRPRIVPLHEGLGSPMYLGGQKQKKVIKLTALKGLMRS